MRDCRCQRRFATPNDLYTLHPPLATTHKSHHTPHNTQHRLERHRHTPTHDATVPCQPTPRTEKRVSSASCDIMFTNCRRVIPSAAKVTSTTIKHGDSLALAAMPSSTSDTVSCQKAVQQKTTSVVVRSNIWEACVQRTSSPSASFSIMCGKKGDTWRLLGGAVGTIWRVSSSRYRLLE